MAKPKPIRAEVMLPEDPKDPDAEVWVEVELPTRWAICGTCEGNGTQALGGLEVTDLCREDPDFAEEYFAGHYDGPCTTCGGAGKVPEIDEDECRRRDMEKELEGYHNYRQAMAEMDAEVAAERRMGA